MPVQPVLTYGLYKNHTMKPVNGRPGAPNAQRDVRGGSLEQRCIDVGLKICGRREVVVHARSERGGDLAYLC